MNHEHMLSIDKYSIYINYTNIIKELRAAIFSGLEATEIIASNLYFVGDIIDDFPGKRPLYLIYVIKDLSGISHDKGELIIKLNGVINNQLKQLDDVPINITYLVTTSFSKSAPATENILNYGKKLEAVADRIIQIANDENNYELFENMVHIVNYDYELIKDEGYEQMFEMFKNCSDYAEDYFELVGKREYLRWNIYHALRKNIYRLMVNNSTTLDASVSSVFLGLYEKAISIIEEIFTFNPHVAAANNHIGIMQLILQKWEDSNQLSKINELRDQFGTPILHKAAFCRHVRMVNLLLDKGAYPAAKNANGETAINCASNREITTMLNNKLDEIEEKRRQNEIEEYINEHHPDFDTHLHLRR